MGIRNVFALNNNDLSMSLKNRLTTTTEERDSVNK